MDDAGVPALVEAIRHIHGLEATWLESVPVVERHAGQIRVGWRGSLVFPCPCFPVLSVLPRSLQAWFPELDA
jgi:hypothetical protein